MTSGPTPNSIATPQEIRRRDDNLKSLEHQTKILLATYNNRTQGTKGFVYLDLNNQDEQLNIIGQGVSNLKQYSLAVKNETDLHARLLDDINIDVDRATSGLESEGDRAEYVAKKSSNFRLYMAILVLSVILVFELIIGGSK
ncbi:unnamed protein product [Aphanomyces euteiches]